MAAKSARKTTRTKRTPAKAKAKAGSAAIYQPYAGADAPRPPLMIAPSMLSSDFAQAARELGKCRRARTPWIHIDVMDGHFVPNITLGPPILKKWVASEPELFYDAHLMIEKPMNFAEQFVEAGAGLVNIHIETTKRPRRDLRAIRRMGVLNGLTIKPNTPVKAIAEFLDEVDLVLVMTVEPGFGGQAMIGTCLNKVRELDLLRREQGLSFRLQVDGGINYETAPVAVAAGADVLVAGNTVFKDGQVQANVRKLRETLRQAERNGA
jgi:ribulose-phosphate 3-epimerase